MKKRRRRVISILPALIVLFASLVVTKIPAEAHTVTYQAADDFEDGTWDYNVEEQLGNTEAITVMEPDFGAAQGTKAVKFDWKKEYYSSERKAKSSEIVTERADWETDVWESFYYYFPSDGLERDSKGAVIKQWIAWQSSISNCNKTFDLEVVNDVLYAHRLWNDSDNPDIAHPNDAAYIVCDSIPKDRWVKFDLHLKFDLDSPDGLIEVWMDDEAKLQVYDVQMGVGMSNYGPYAKYGPYVYGSSNYPERFFYADDIKWSYEPFFEHSGEPASTETDPAAWYGAADFDSGLHALGTDNTETSTVEFDITPFLNYLDGCVGYTDSSTIVTSYSSFNMIVRMNTDGYFDARNGASYTALTKVPYQKDNTYHVKIVADIANKSYDVWITPKDGEAVKIAENYAFRTGAPSIDDLGQVCLIDSIMANEFKVNNHTVNGVSAPEPETPEPEPDGGTTVVEVKDNKDAILTMIMDDGYKKSSEFYKSEFETYHLKGSLALIYEWVEKDPDYWKSLVNTGLFDVQSHSVSHDDLTLSDVDEEKLNYEIIDSKSLLQDMFPDQDVLGFIPPENKSNGAADEIIMANYYAMRKGYRGFNRVSPSSAEWYNLQVQGVLNTASEATMLSWIDKAVDNKKWLIEMWHGVQEYDPSTYAPVASDIADRHFAYISEKQEEGEIWVATFGEAIKYIRERQAAAINETTENDIITVSLTDNLPDDLFDFPLTLKSEVPATWEIAYVTQNGTQVSEEVADESDGKSYIYYDAVPDTGDITISQKQETVGEKIFYNRTFDEVGQEPFEGLSVKNKSNIIAIEEENGNHFINMQMADTVTQDCHLDMDITDPSRFMVIQMDLSVSDLAAGGNIQYKDLQNSTKYLLYFGKNGIKTADYKTVATFSENTWISIALALDLQSAVYKVYINGNQVGEEASIQGANSEDSIKMLRIYLNNSNTAQSALRLDNYRVYEGIQPRELTESSQELPQLQVSLNPSKANGLGDWYTSPVTLALQPDKGVEYSLDNSSTWISYSEPVVLDTDGTYTILYRYLLSSKSDSVQLAIDTAAPVTEETITGDVNDDGAYKGSASLQLTATDRADGSGVMSTEYSENGQDWITYTKPVELVEKGTYNIMYHSVDNAGNVEENHTTSIIVVDADDSGVTKDVPGKPVLSNDNGYDTGLLDGNYQVEMNLWWGINATGYKLYENGVLIETQELTQDTPNAQSTVTSISGKENGTYEYYCELSNENGVTVSDTMTVTVTQANPGLPVLSNDNWNGNGDYIVTMNMWWGTNGTTYKLYENDALIETKELGNVTPGAQTVNTTITEKPAGSYTYYCELITDAGVTKSQPMTITVN